MNARQLLERLLELAGGARERGYVLAIDGDGLEDLPAEWPTATAVYRLHRPTTELALRRILLESKGAPFIALLPRALAQKLPPDLVRRAQGQKIFALELSEVVSTLLDVPLTGMEDEALLRLALDSVEGLRELLRQRTLPTVIDARLLDELLVDARLGARFRSILPGRLLADWVRLQPEVGEAELALIRRALPVHHGTEGSVLAWALEEPRRLRALIVHGALLDIEGEMPPTVWGPLRDAPKHKAIGLEEEVFRRTVKGLARQAIDELGDEAGPILLEAENLGRQLLAPGVLAQSTLLPLGLANRCQEIARKAAQGPVAAREIRWLRRHRAAKLKQAEIELLEELARLSRYLDRPVASAASVGERIEAWQESGAFADLAAERARRALAATSEFHAEAKKILDAYLARRNVENHGFAKALAKGYVAALHSDEVIPLHRLWSRTVKARKGPGWSLSRSEGEGGLFLVVMDGCSYPVFLELLEELSRDTAFEIGFELEKGAVAKGLPGLAPLPTITSHARSSIFLGEIPKDPWLSETRWREEKERVTDPARFKQNADLGSRTRRLFLKGDLADSGRELLEALRDPKLEVVAAVFNAVDDLIGSSNTGARIRARPKEISGFLPSLRTALEQGRKVLLVADHGHSPYWGKELRVGAGSTPRFVELEEGREVPEGFIELELGELGGSPGRKAFAWKIGAYLGMPQVGFHGGCGLEEMVVPMAWLQKGGVPADVPSWWHGTGAAADPDAVAWEIPARRPLLERTPGPLGWTPSPPVDLDPQPEMIRLRAGASGAGGPEKRKVDSLAREVEKLAQLEKALPILDRDERAALVVLAQNETVTSTELAAAVERHPGRITGFMSQLQRKLRGRKVVAFEIESIAGGELRYRSKIRMPK